MDGLRLSGIDQKVVGADEFKTSVNKLSDSKPGEKSFGDELKSAIDVVDKLQKDADFKMQQLATGKSQNIHETMIATEKADLALRLMVQVRNKVLDAYHEIMKMQV